MEQVDANIWSFWGKFSEGGGIYKPFRWELQIRVIQIFTIEGAECENVTWRGVGLEIGGKVCSRLLFQRIAIVFYHFVGDLDSIALVEG